MRAIVRARRDRDERGVAAVEFAIVGLLLLVFLYGILTYGFIFALQHSLTHGATEGARAAVRAPATQETALATERAREALAFRKAKDNAVINSEVITGADCEPSSPSVRCIRVVVTYDYSTFPILPPLLDIATPDLMTGKAVVQLDD